MRDIVLKYPIWQQPYRAAVIEANPKLLKDKIAVAEQAAMLRLGQLESSADHHHEVIGTNRRAGSTENTRRIIWAE
jgi:hypothetical protein